jgi:hypothetical protein
VPANWDGISEDWFDSFEAMAAAFASPAAQALAADAPNFLDLPKCEMLTVAEDEVLASTQSGPSSNPVVLNS